MKNIKNYLWILLVVYVSVSILFYHKLGYLALICMFAPLVVAPFAGRRWCGNFCPRGNFIDKIITKFSRNKDMPQFMLKPQFRWTIFTFLMSFFTFQVVNAWGDWSQVGLVIASVVFITTLITVLVGIIWRPRTWCTSFCPMGTLANTLSTGKGNIAFDSGCVSCRLCTKACPMQLDTAAFKAQGEVTDPRCIRCGECINACPKDILTTLNSEEKLKEKYAN